jgi:hypothetical protein
MRRFFLLLSLLMLIGFYHPATAQSAIGFGQTVTGRIANDAFRILYAFTGRQGDIIDITVTRTDGNLDPILILTDDHNNLIARDDDGGSSYNAALISQPLPHDGTYFLIVSRFGQERGLTVGAYSLTLSRVGITGGQETALQYGDSVVGQLNGEQFQQVFIFQAKRGDIIRASLQRIAGDLDPYLMLADAQGVVMTVNDEDPNSPGTLDAVITNLRIMRTGNYILVATRFGREAGSSKGGFSLTLDRLPPDSLGKTADKAVMLDYGGMAEGSIDADNLVRYYLIEGHKGDLLTITATRTRGNLDPTATLYTSDLRAIISNDSGQRGQSAIISAYTVPADETYILVVSRFNRDNGITAGDYAVTLIGRTSIAVGPDGRAALPYNSAVRAIINDSNVAQVYTFAGAAGDVVTINMETTSGNLLASLNLYDQNSKLIVQDDAGSERARLNKVKLPRQGGYIIVATRRNREKGSSQGSYLLTLTKESTSR